MSAHTVIVGADVDEFLKTMASLTELLERLHQIINGFVDIRESSFEFASVVLSDDTALGTGNLRACLKPSDRLLGLVAALRACERELLIAKELTHA